MSAKLSNKDLENLPVCAQDFIRLVIKKMRYRKKVRVDVMAELTAHFEDELKSCAAAVEKEKKAQRLIVGFGDATMLAILMRRAKKRCRPLWRTIVARTIQTVSVLILSFILYLSWFLSGKPVITKDYMAELNRIVQPTADESLNAAPLYNEAAKLCEESASEDLELLRKRFSEATDEEKLLIKKWLSDNEETLDLIVAGTQKPYYWRQYEAQIGNELITVLMPDLAGYRRLAYSFRWRSRFKAEEDLYEECFAIIKSGYRLGQHLKSNTGANFIEQLVGIAIEALSVGQIRKILSEYEIDSNMLAVLQKDLEQMTADEEFAINIKTEKLMVYDELQRCFTKDRFGGGHLYLPRIVRFSDLDFEEPDEPKLYKKALSILMSPKIWPRMVRILFFHPDKEQTRQTVNNYYAFWEKMSHKSPAWFRRENIDVGKEAWEIAEGNIFLEILAPNIDKIIQISNRIKADVAATITLMAILRYEKDFDRYPDNLGELQTAGYIKQIPIDPFSDKPIIYKKTDDGFTFYSVGLNFEDEGGQYAKIEEGRFGVWAENGDAVFWPIVE